MKKILAFLEPRPKATTLKSVTILNNMLGRDRIKLLVRLMKVNSFTLSRNEIQHEEHYFSLVDSTKHEEDFFSLIDSAKKHPTLAYIGIPGCGIGIKLPTMPDIVPALLSLKAVSLSDNGIGSHGASLISNCSPS